MWTLAPRGASALTLASLAVAIAVLGVGLGARRPRLVLWSVALLAVAYAARLTGDHRGSGTDAPLIAAALFAIAELGLEATALHRGQTVERDVVARWALARAALVAGAVALGGAVLAAATLDVAAGAAPLAAGLLAELLAVALIAALARGGERVGG